MIKYISLLNFTLRKKNSKIKNLKNFLVKSLKSNKIKLNINPNCKIYNHKLNRLDISKKKKNNLELIFKKKKCKRYMFKERYMFRNLIKLCKILKKNFIIISKFNKRYIYKYLNTIKRKNSIIKDIRESSNSYYSYINVNYNNTTRILFNKYKQNYYIEYNSKFICRDMKRKLIKNKKRNSLVKNKLSGFKHNFKIDLYILLNKIKKYLKYNIFGQNKILTIISEKLLRVHYKKTYKKPISNIFLCGTSGTGKTEISKIMSCLMGKDYDNLIKYDMSNFKNISSVSKLLGSPPGYEGYDKKEEIQTLPDKILKKPSCVVLLDEIEKANVKVSNIFLQVMDEGILTDAKGVKGNFKKSFVIFTSNLGTDKIELKNKLDKNKLECSKFLKHEFEKNEIIKSINNYFAPEFINRLDDILIFDCLDSYSLYSLFGKHILNEEFVNFDKLSKYLISYLFYNPLKGSRFLLNCIDSIILTVGEKGELYTYCDNNIPIIKCYML